jgi:type I restriction enzyme S subunit
MTPQELKASILNLAMQGKLVEQRFDEGTAKELCEKLLKEKEQLIKTGVIKIEKALPAISDEEIPYDIPDGWIWVRLGDYCQKVTDQVASGSFASLRENVPSLKDPDYAIMVKTADFANEFTRNLTYTTKHGYEFLENSNLFGGELILSNIGSIGKCFIVPDLGCKMTLAPNAVMVRLIDNELRDYLYYFIMSPQGYQSLLSITSGTAMKKFNKTDLKKILIPIPPLAEQKRIVAKIEELLPLIDRYEQAWSKLEDFNKRFPGDMQKSILQMAIQGKLVPQLPEEGTGEELFQQIQAEKQALIRAGKIKKEKPLPEIAEDEIPFDIPESWKWVYIGDLFQHNTGKALNSSDKSGSPMEYITTSNVYWNSFTLDKLKTMLFTEAEVDKCTVQKGDLLVLEGGDVGRAAIWNYDFPMRIQNHIHRLRPYGSLSVDYFYHVFFLYKNAGMINGKGIGIKGLSSGTLHSLLVPLPPLAEQKRIVAKLEEILPLCERLK